MGIIIMEEIAKERKTRMLNREGFDLWADGYDRSVGLSDEDGSYPFAGYRDILNAIYGRILSDGGRDVLDVGFGTGVLAARLYQRRIAVKRRRGHVPGLQKIVEAAIRDDEQSGVPRLDGDGQQKARRLRERQHDGHPGKLRQAPVADFFAERDFHLGSGLHGDADGRPRLEGEHLGGHGDVQAVHHAPHLKAQILGFGRN